MIVVPLIVIGEATERPTILAGDPSRCSALSSELSSSWSSDV